MSLWQKTMTQTICSHVRVCSHGLFSTTNFAVIIQWCLYYSHSHITQQLQVLRGSVYEETIMQSGKLTKNVSHKDVVEFVSPEIQISCLKLAKQERKVSEHNMWTYTCTYLMCKFTFLCECYRHLDCIIFPKLMSCNVQSWDGLKIATINCFVVYILNTQ